MLNVNYDAKENMKETLRRIESHPSVLEDEGKHKKETIREVVSEAMEKENRRNRNFLSHPGFFSEERTMKRVIELQDKKFLSVELENKDVKKKGAARKLKDDVQYRDVCIRPDLTYRQSKVELKLTEEMKARVKKKGGTYSKKYRSSCRKEGLKRKDPFEKINSN